VDSEHQGLECRIGPYQGRPVTALDAVAQEPLKGPSITLGQEDRLAVVTASDEVIEGSTVVLSRFPSHTLEDAKRTPGLASCRPGTGFIYY